jgi:DHA1 family tetracycline resistance protein-like MFS transporter
VGFIAGPALGGVLASYGPQYPFLAAAFLNLAGFLFGYFVLPESLLPGQRRKMEWGAINPFRAFHHVFSFPAIRVLVAIFVCLQLAGQTHPSIWTLYTEHRYGWSSAEVGWSLAAVGLLSALSQGFLTGFLVQKWGEGRVMVVGLFGEALCFSLFGLADKGIYVYFIIVLSSLFWSSPPALQSLVTREVEASKQGELQGTLMSLTSLTAILNPLLVTRLFSLTSTRGSAWYAPGSPYFFSAGMLVLAGTLALPYWKKSTKEKALHLAA